MTEILIFITLICSVLNIALSIYIYKKDREPDSSILLALEEQSQMQKHGIEDVP
jgi:hypothetical protein